MKKQNKIIMSCSGAGCLLVFNILFFLLAGTDIGAGIWLIYAFADVIFLCVIIVPWLLKNKPQAKDENAIRLEEISFIKTNSLALKAISDRCEDKELSYKIERLYNKLHSAQSVSCKAAEETEREITDKIQQLDKDITSGEIEKADDLVKYIDSLIIKRNNILSVNNINLQGDM